MHLSDFRRTPHLFRHLRIYSFSSFYYHPLIIKHFVLVPLQSSMFARSIIYILLICCIVCTDRHLWFEKENSFTSWHPHHSKILLFYSTYVRMYVPNFPDFLIHFKVESINGAAFFTSRLYSFLFICSYVPYRKTIRGDIWSTYLFWV